MRTIVLGVFLLFTFVANAQLDSTKHIRAFPITDYITHLNDSVVLVQVHLPDGLTFREKQMGLIKGLYMSSIDETDDKGYGRCNLIKGNYYYFTIGNNKSGMAIKAGDLLYTETNKPTVYDGLISKIAKHHIGLLNVYDEKFYDRYNVFVQWTKEDERKLLDSLVADIKLTGNYFKMNSPEMNMLIEKGSYKDKRVLDQMLQCKVNDLTNFLSYIIARPRLYAGKEWKISEIFATWMVEGSPTVKE